MMNAFFAMNGKSKEHKSWILTVWTPQINAQSICFPFYVHLLTGWSIGVQAGTINSECPADGGTHPWTIKWVALYRPKNSSFFWMTTAGRIFPPVLLDALTIFGNVFPSKFPMLLPSCNVSLLGQYPCFVAITHSIKVVFSKIQNIGTLWILIYGRRWQAIKNP